MLCRLQFFLCNYVGGVQMKKSGYLEQFKKFMKNYNLTETKVKQIITEYANTVDEQSASFFTFKYNITSYAFYRLRDFAIILMLVDDHVCKRIRDKSFRNQSGKNSSGNYTAANKHYKVLMEKRKEYLKSFSTEEIVLISIEYANGDSLHDIAKKHCISEYTIRKLLSIALVEHLVCDKVYHAIKFRSDTFIRSLGDYRGYTAEDLWLKYSHWE